MSNLSYSLTDIESYRNEHDKLQDLQTQRAELAAEVREAQRHYNERTDIGAEVDAVLSGVALDTAIATRTEIQQLNHRLRVLDAAIESQKQTVQQAVCEASAEILDRARPEYQRIVKRMADILAALRKVCCEEREMRTALRESGCWLTNEFILPFRNCGEPARDGVRDDLIALWEQQAREAGMI